MSKRPPKEPLGFTLLTTFADEKYDHYCVKGDDPCPDFEPAGMTWPGKAPKDARRQCRRCTWAPHCLQSDQGLYIDVVEIELDPDPTRADRDDDREPPLDYDREDWERDWEEQMAGR